MNQIVNYIVESSISLGVLSLFYVFVLRKSGMLRFKRFYLILSIVFAALIPLGHFSIDKSAQQSEQMPTVHVLETFTIVAGELTEITVPFIERNTWIVWFYSVGILFLLARLLYGLIRIGMMGRSFRSKKIERFRLFITDGKFNPFSFFRWVFIARNLWEGGNAKAILAHEKEHAEQLHSFDIMILELLLIVQWFNPFIWLVRREVKDNHEFLADRAVLSSGISKTDYLRSMLFQIVGPRFEIGNNFSLSITQKRLKMMKTNQSKNTLFKHISISAIVFVMLGLSLATDFSVMAQEELKVEDEVFIVVEKMPSYPGGFEAFKKDLTKEVVKANRKSKFKKEVSSTLFFTVSEKGKVEAVKAVKVSNLEFSKSVVKALTKIKKWNHGEQRGKAVPVDYSLVIKQTPNGNVDFNGLGVHAKVMLVNSINTTITNGKKTVSAVVLDSKKKPLPGASVIVKGTTGKFSKGTVTDANGKYTLDLEKAATELVISYVGYKTYKMPLTKKDISTEKDQTENELFMVVEEMPEFPGGKKELMKFIGQSVAYPKDAAKNGIEGKVFVDFIVDKSGEIRNVGIERGVDPLLNAEAMRVVKTMPNWTPGKQRGKLVNVRYVLPINFSLAPKPIKQNVKKALPPPPPPSAKVTKEVAGDEVFMVVEKMPQFPGGQDSLMRYLGKTVKYPKEAQATGTQGRVFVSFVIAKDGSISKVDIARGVSPSLDEEAMRVVKSMPNWVAGVQRGKKVNVKYMLPINFVLQGKSPQKGFEVAVDGSNVSFIEPVKAQLSADEAILMIINPKDAKSKKSKELTIGSSKSPSEASDFFKKLSSSLSENMKFTHVGNGLNVQFTAKDQNVLEEHQKQLREICRGQRNLHINSKLKDNKDGTFGLNWTIVIKEADMKRNMQIEKYAKQNAGKVSYLIKKKIVRT